MQLAVYLDNVAAIVNRTIQTIEKLPQLVQSLTGALPGGAGGVLPNVAQPLQDPVARRKCFHFVSKGLFFDGL